MNGSVKMEEATFSAPMICCNNHKSEDVGEPCRRRGNPEAKMLFEWGKKPSNSVALLREFSRLELTDPKLLFY